MLETELIKSTQNQSFDIGTIKEDASIAVKKISDKGWEVIQKKTFTNWINTQLKVRDIAPIVNVVTDFSTGEINESLGKMNSKPKMRLQMIENCNIALNFVKCRGVHLTNIGSEDIVDCNEKLILGLIWTIILRFTISTISEEGLSAKDGLLLWCQRKTIPYRSDYEIKDFTTSWMDGLALCGLIHSHRPDLIDYWALNKKNKFENTKLAFEIAEKYLGIPQLFAVEDIVDVVRPDERSVITYIAQYFHKLTVINKFQTAGSQIEQLGLHHQRLTQMQMLYENRAKELISSINIIQFTWNESKLTSYEDARNELTQFYTYKKNLKREWMVEKFELYSILDSIQEEAMKLNTFQYDPPAEVCLRTLNNHWFKLEAAELNRYRQLKDFMNDDKQRLLDKFINGAMDFQKQLQHLSIQLSMIDGDIDEMIHQTDLLVRQIFPLKLHLEALSDTYNQCVKRNIGDVEIAIISYDDLAFELESLSHGAIHKLSFLKSEKQNIINFPISTKNLEMFIHAFCSDNHESIEHQIIQNNANLVTPTWMLSQLKELDLHKKGNLIQMQKDTNIDEAISTNQSNTSLALLVGGAVTCIAAISLSSHYFFGRSSIYRHKLTKDVISIEKYMFLLPPKLKKEGIKLVDLNSEDRNILLQAAKLNRSITESVGLHFKNSRYFMSLFLSHVHNYPKTVRFIRTDYLKYNLSRFDVTVVRNIPSDIEKLGMKLNKELKVDSLVITKKFQFPGWSPILTEGEMNIYQIGIHQANKSK